MKPWKIILSIVLLLFSIIRIAATCNKQKRAAIKNEFSERIRAIESARAGIFGYSSSVPDSSPINKDQARLFNKVNDSAIDHYRNIYKSDEKRYKQYLKVLFAYKKLFYEYQKIGKLYTDKEVTKKERESRYREIEQDIRSISFEMDRERLAAAWEIYD